MPCCYSDYDIVLIFESQPVVLSVRGRGTHFNFTRLTKGKFTMIPIFKSMPILLVGVLSLSLLNPAWGQVAVKSVDEIEKESQQYWDKMSDHLDPVALDQFISKYPDSQAAAMAFALRYTMLADNPNIEDYNDFLKKYPNRFQSQIALQELFELYRDQNRANGYLDFLQRYPDTQQALVAKLRLQTLMFQLVSLTDKGDEYEAFIDTFPEAPQVPAVSQLAFEKELQEEKTRFNDLKKESDSVCERRANSLVTEWEDWVGKFSKQFPGDKASEPGALVFMYRIDRRAKVIRSVYGAYHAAARIRQEERHQEIIAKLDGIQTTLIKNNAELIKTLREESKRICDELKAGFELLHHDNLDMRKMIEQKFEAIEKGMQRLHEDLVTIHKDLLDIRGDLKTINDSIKEGNKKLDRLDAHLHGIYAELVEVRKDMNTGFQAMGEKMDALTREVKTGFETSHRLQLHQIEISGRILEQTQIMTAVMSNGYGIVSNQDIQQVLSRNTINVMRRGFGDLKTGQDRQIAMAECNLRINNDITRLQMRSLNASRQDMEDRQEVFGQVMSAGYSKTGQNVWATSGHATQENYRTLSLVQNEVGGHGQRAAWGATGGVKRSLIGTVLGVVAGGVAIYCGAPQFAIVAYQAGQMAGDRLWHHGKDYIRERLEENYPGSASIATTIIEGSWAQRKNFLFAAASRLAGEDGLPGKLIDMIGQCVTGEDLQNAVHSVAEYLGIAPNVLEFAADNI